MSMDYNSKLKVLSRRMKGLFHISRGFPSNSDYFVFYLEAPNNNTRSNYFG